MYEFKQFLRDLNIITLNLYLEDKDGHQCIWVQRFVYIGELEYFVVKYELGDNIKSITFSDNGTHKVLNKQIALPLYPEDYIFFSDIETKIQEFFTANPYLINNLTVNSFTYFDAN